MKVFSAILERELWRWSVTEEGKTKPAAPCLYHEGGHKTREEAETCWWEWALSELKPVARPRRQCAVAGCPDPSERALAAPDGFPVSLCEKHLQAEGYRQARSCPKFHSYAAV